MVWIQSLTAYTFIIIDSTHAIRNHQSINSIHRLAHLTALVWTGSKRAIEKNATCWNVSWAGATSPCPLNPSFSSLTSQSSVANSSKDQTESQQHQPIKNYIIIFDKNSFLGLRIFLLTLYPNINLFECFWPKVVINQILCTFAVDLVANWKHWQWHWPKLGTVED